MMGCATCGTRSCAPRSLVAADVHDQPATVAGLAVLALASFRPIVYFGVLVVFTLAATCASTLLVLPALLAILPGDDRLTRRSVSGKMPGSA